MSKNYELSIIIPARNEEFLKVTIENILENIEADTEIIAVLDGEWADPQIVDNDRVNLIYVPEAIGQRAATNIGVRLSKAKYVMKLDAHCSVDKGFDRKMIEKMDDNWTMVPIMRNLWMFSWNCRNCNWKKYQGPTPEKCEKCGSANLRKKMMIVGKERPQSHSYCFDKEPHFQYFREYSKRPEVLKQVEETGLSETMSLQGSCFMSTREKYWELELCDESLGSWGNQGIEVAMKTKLSGGKVMVNHDTWYADMFRTQGGDFSFPYKQKGNDVSRTKKRVKNLFWGSQWDKAIYPLSKAVEEFMPIPGWDEKAIKELKENEIKAKRAGIYLIKSLTNNRVYIGSSINLSDRILGHKKELSQNIHGNNHLQNNWNKYGENDLEFSILYFCKEDDLIKNEQRFIDEYKEKIGWDSMFNICPIAGSTLGVKCSDETKEKISIAQTGKTA